MNWDMVILVAGSCNRARQVSSDKHRVDDDRLDGAGKLANYLGIEGGSAGSFYCESATMLRL